jgi:hypothetical protein
MSRARPIKQPNDARRVTSWRPSLRWWMGLGDGTVIRDEPALVQAKDRKLVDAGCAQKV